MNKSIFLILAAVVAFPFASCETNPVRSDTVFHPADESPRSGDNGDGRNRYGRGGTHSPSEREETRRERIARERRERMARRERESEDPDGIVKPRDLDPDDGEGPEIVSGGTGTPEEETTAPDKKEVASNDGGSSGGGNIPFAEAVPGKYGLVYSPFVKDKKNGLVNVTDDNDVAFPPGTEVTDPHTGKVFKVP